MKKYLTILLCFICFHGLHSQTEQNCNLKKGIYISFSGEDTTFHKISKKHFIGYSKKTNFYYKNKLEWGDSCKFRSAHFKNNSNLERFKRGTGYQCQLISLTDQYFTFTYIGEVTGSKGELKYIRYKGRIPKRFKRIKKMNHTPRG